MSGFPRRAKTLIINPAVIDARIAILIRSRCVLSAVRLIKIGISVLFAMRD